MSIYPFFLIFLGIILGSLVWSVIGLVRVRSDRSSRLRYAVVFIVGSVFCWLIWCLLFVGGASLGHSADPFADSWLPCLVGTILFLVLPAGFLGWCRRRTRKDAAR